MRSDLYEHLVIVFLAGAAAGVVSYAVETVNLLWIRAQQKARWEQFLSREIIRTKISCVC